jgi:catalase (peroxidase I)
MTPQELQTPNSQANLVLHKTLRVHDGSAESEEALLIEIAWHAAGFYDVRDAYWL